MFPIIQIMRRSIFMTAFAVAALASCNRIDTPEMGNNALDISVRNGMGTKAVVEGTTLPAGSSIGLFVTDESGKTYDGNTVANAKYTATGEGDAQKWNAASDVLLSATVANVNSYYPYDDSVNDITAIPIEATSEVQKDWMWGTPVSGLDNKNTSATITMSHALAVVRLNINKNNYPGAGKITSVSFNSNGAGTSAVMNATNGELTDIKGTGLTFENIEELILGDNATSVSFITIPTNTAAPLTISMIIDGKLMKVQTADITLLQGNIYDCNLSINMSTLSLNKLNVTKWTVEQMEDIEVNPFAPVVNYSGNNTNFYTDNPFNIEQYYKDKTLTVKISTDIGHEVKEVKVTGGVSTQYLDENGTRTIIITDIISDITITFNGTTFNEWARIQHVDGTLYTAEEWLAAEAAGEVTDADANGVAVRYSKYAACPHVIHPKYGNSPKWSSTTLEVPGIPMITDITAAKFDVDGKANTDAILKAAISGTIVDAPAAQYCADVTFANGQKGYLPAAGELQAWYDNKTAVNACMNAIGANQVDNDSWTYTWSSTQYSTTAWAWSSSKHSYMDINKSNGNYVRPVTSFSY